MDCSVRECAAQPDIDLQGELTLIRGLRKPDLCAIQASNLVTDDYLQSLAPFLPCLEHLHLAGCPRVTHAGITSLLAQNPEGIVELGLEGLSPTFVR